jgi:pullulanase
VNNLGFIAERQVTPSFSTRIKSLLPLIAVVVASCRSVPTASQAKYFPPPQPTGSVVATVNVAPPPGNEGRTVFAGLKLNGRIVARGQAVVPRDVPLPVAIRAMESTQSLTDGEYELWLTINRDALQSCYPSYGDWFVHEKWNLSPASAVKTLADPSVWKQRQLSQPGNLITVHYHRYDEDYDNVSVWTWDMHYKRTPEQNEIFEVGRDDYGPILELDRADYGENGGSDRIGLVARLAGDWNRKDGDDKLWRADMGNAVYLVGSESQVWSNRPDTSPQVAAAYVDAPNRLVIRLSRPVTQNDALPDKITITDDQHARQHPTTVQLLLKPGTTTANDVELELGTPLDIARHVYQVSVQGFGSGVRTQPRGILDNADLFCDDSAVLGATYTPTATTFRVFAPTASTVHVVTYDQATGDQGRSTHPMSALGKGVWEATVAGDLQGKFYLYKLQGQGFAPDREALDIYCINAVDNSQRARITDLPKTNPPGWDQAKTGPALDSPVDMVVYEMHVRDFTIAANSGVEHKGQYLGFAEAGTHLPDDPAIKTGLDHLTELGVTHVQLMPIQDFENDEVGTNYNWGYVTTAYNSPEGWYATDRNDESRIREFKQLVAALHQRGIGVIMDVVYNHTANSAQFNFLVPRYYYRYSPNGNLSNGSGCGNDFRSESPMGRKFVLDTLTYWVREYGIDGFRFDIMGLLDLDTMKQVEAELRAINPHIVLYGEAWGGGAKGTNMQTIRGTRLGGFNVLIRNALIAPPYGSRKGGFIPEGTVTDNLKHAIEGSWRDSGLMPAQEINYLSCHDGLVVWDKLKAYKPAASDAEVKEMMKLGYLLLFTSQGVPFLHGGEEFARTKSGNRNSYDAPDNINEVDWSLKKTNYDLFAYTRDLIALRKTHPVFRLRAKEQITSRLKFLDSKNPSTVMFTLDADGLDGEAWKHVCVIANSADSASYAFVLPDGPWHIALDANGAPKEDKVVDGTVSVPAKSGLILYQE